MATFYSGEIGFLSNRRRQAMIGRSFPLFSPRVGGAVLPYLFLLSTTQMSGIIPSGDAMHTRLTTIQQNVLEMIRDRHLRGEPPPTYREVCSFFGWASTATARDHLRALTRKGYIRHETKRAHRNLRLGEELPSIARIPVIGRVVAGHPVLSEESREGWLEVSAELARQGTFFAMRVSGDSMRDAGISTGDYAIARQQQTAEDGAIVVATIEGETTIKRLKLQRGCVELVPENREYAPIPVRTESAAIQGIVVAIYRRIEGGFTHKRFKQGISCGGV